jgi:nucleotide-binding universal stress UspA family protein
MRILIAYDESECSDAAIVDLRRAGLPAVAEACVLSTAPTSPPVEVVPYAATAAGTGIFFPESLETEPPYTHELQKAQAFARQAADRLGADFPGWRIDTEAWVDYPGPAIIRKAGAWNPDLVVVGSHGLSGIRRFLLGSVSQHALHHAACSVRISRHHLHSQERSIRILIGVDGSENAKAAVTAVATRQWPAGTEARAVGVLDSRIALAAATTPVGTIPAEIEDESRLLMSKAVHEAAKELERAGLRATHQVLGGNPGEVLLAEAERWAADCVFVGARGLNRLVRFLLGSVSTAVASRAHCSVEVVRAHTK